MKNLYQQCLLHKGTSVLTSWIPSKFAKKGKFIKLKVNSKWSYNWIVVTAFGIKVTEENKDMLENQHRYNRKETDI